MEVVGIDKYDGESSVDGTRDNKESNNMSMVHILIVKSCLGDQLKYSNIMLSKINKNSPHYQ